ncbi:NFAT activation molecule 1 isoform X2 [Camelus bactrianus]|uniref:NFAT activation molecule 1 isoform X2 n=1 Tax=Camelus bactrianus TaxID=9837 RepID=A0AC58RB38_CAMBA
MESWPPWWCAPPGPHLAPRLLGLFLLPWALQLAGGQSVTHTGLPIVVSLANKAVSFSCRITYPYIPKFKNFRVSYFHVDLQGQRSSEEQTGCTLHQGRENKTHTTVCQVTPKLPNASATGTYYCSVHWQNSSITGNGTFILVRDTGYQDPSQGPQKLLLFCFVGFLTVLSILGTALLLWKKLILSKSCPQSIQEPAPCLLPQPRPGLHHPSPENRSMWPRSAWAPALLAAWGSLHPNPSTQTCSAERPRSTPASRRSPAARPPTRAFSLRRNSADLRMTVNLTWSMKISRTNSTGPRVLPWVRGPGAASLSGGLNLHQQ